MKSNAFKKKYERIKKELNDDERIPSAYYQNGEMYNFWRDEKNVRGVWRKTSFKSYLKDENSDEILKKAEEIEKISNQLLNYTNIIKQNSLEIKKDIIEHLWKVLISDNTVDQYESNLMRRICGLIYFSDKECAEIKLKLLNSK